MSYTINIDTKDSVKSIEELKKKVESLKKSLESMDKTSSSYSKTSKELANAQKKLANAQKSLADQASKTSSSMKDLNSNTEKVSSNLSKSTKSTKSATDNFKKMREEIRDLRSDFYGTKEGTEEYNRALSALGDKMQEFKDMQAAANASAADFGAVCGNLVGVANGVVGGISALSGAMQIFGMGNSEFLEKLESKSMAVIQVVQGLAAVEDALTKKLPLVLNVYKQYNQKLLEHISARKSAKAQVESNTLAEQANTSATLANSTAKATNNGASAASTSNTAAYTAQVTANTAALSQNVSALDVLKGKLAGVDAELKSLNESDGLNDIFSPNAGMGSILANEKQNLEETISLYEKYGEAANELSDQIEETISSAQETAGGLNQAAGSAQETAEGLNQTAGSAQAASAGLNQTAGSAQAASTGLKSAGASASVAAKRFTLLNAVGHTLKTTWMNLRAMWASNPLGLIILGVGLLVAGIKKLVGWLDKISGAKIVIKDVRGELDKTRESINNLNDELQHMVNMGRITKRESLETMLSTLKQERKDTQDLLNESNDQIHQLTSRKYFLGLGKNSDSKLLEQAKKNQEELNNALKEYDKQIRQTTWDIEELDYTQSNSVNSGKDSVQSKADALKSWLESFEDGLKTQAQLLAKEHKEELDKLKESLNAGLLTQDQYNELKLQSDKRYVEKRKELMKSSNEDLKKLLEELGSWESGQRSPMQEIIDEFNEGQDILDKALDKGEISYEDYLKAMERLSARYAKKLRSALFDKVSGDVDNLNRKLQRESSNKASNYDVEISSAESHGRIIDAVQLRIDKENELFRIEQEGIQKEMDMWQQAADSCKEGSEEQVEALERVAEAQDKLNQSTNKHTIATNDNKQAMADAKIGYRSFNDALKDTLGLTAEQANAFEMATNMAGDLMNELANTIGAFADEALAQSENEELTEEAREKAFQQYKDLQIAQTTINYMSGLMATWKSAAEMTPPACWIYGGAMTAMQSAQYALSIRAIKRQSMDSPSTELGASSSSFNIAAPTYTTAEANIQAARPASDTKVYVLESDISNAQNKNKVRVNDTTF